MFPNTVMTFSFLFISSFYLDVFSSALLFISYLAPFLNLSLRERDYFVITFFPLEAFTAPPIGTEYCEARAT